MAETKVTSPIGGYLNVNDQSFLNAWNGYIIVDNSGGGDIGGKPSYKVTSSGVYDAGPFNPNIPNQNARTFSKETGIDPTPNWSGGSTSEKFKYFTTPEKEAAKAVTSNFGLGQNAPNPDQYTGKTYGQTSGGKTLYELKDGNVTSVAPPESVKITGDVVAEKTPPTIQEPTTPLPAGAGKKLSPDEYYNARIAYGVSPKNFDEFFIKSGNDIYIKQGITVPQAPGVSTPSTPTSQPQPDGIKWHPGLSETQKRQIMNLVQSKPRDQWDARDVANYNFATGSKEDVIAPAIAGQPTGTPAPAKGKTDGQVLGQDVTEGMGQAFFRGKAALIKFSEDPDGPGPQSMATIWYADPVTKNLYPILSPEAFNNTFEETLDEVGARGGITTISLQSLNPSGALEGFTMLKDDQGIGSGNEFKKPEATVDASKLQTRYGKPRDEELERAALKQIDGLFTMIKNDPNTGISPGLVDEISNDVEIMAAYINAFAYGEYNPNDIYRDIKRRQLVQSGRDDLKSLKVIDEGTIASQYYGSDTGKTIRANADLLPPEYIGDIDTGLLDSSIFKIPKEVYDILVPPLDFRSPQGQAELDKIKSAYHDVLIKQLEATTDREKVIADQDYKKIKDDLKRFYNIALSDNASQAWSQISSLGEQYRGRSLGSSGLLEEAHQRYLTDIRKTDERLRTEQLSKEETERRNYLLQSGSPQEIAKLSDAEKARYGFLPSEETRTFFSPENLQKQYPNLSPDEVKAYQTSIIDPTSNTYRSQLFQTLQKNRYGVQQEKRSFQLGGVQTDPQTGEIISAAGALGKKALEEEERYRQFDETPSLPTREKATTSINL